MKKIICRFEALATLVGAVIGLGIFAVPYAVKNIGITPAATLTILLCILMVFLSIIFAEIVVFSGNRKHIVGYAHRHLGALGGKVQMFSVFFGYGGALLAYLLAGTIFLQSLIPNGAEYFWEIVLIFTAINGLVLIRDVYSLGFIELILTFFLIIVFIILFIFGIPHWQETENSWRGFFSPYGVIWFALAGISSIPIIVRILKGQKKQIIKVIGGAYLVVLLLTLGFLITVLKVGGGKVGLDPFTVLGEKMGSWVNITGSLVGFIAIVTSYWVLGTFLRNSLTIDLKFPKIASWAVVTLAPLLFLIIGIYNFVDVISIVGIVAGTIDAMIIILMYVKIFGRGKKSPLLPFKVPGFVFVLISIFLISVAISSLVT